MLRFSDIVFGPIHSRRLGSSLGINLLPSDGKLCNFDCIYCECGWNKDGRTQGKLPDLEEISSALEAALKLSAEKGTVIDSITFSGNGEPTLHPQFPQIVDAVIALRDKFYPSACVSVLSNATMLDKDGIFKALKKIDKPILKIDAPTSQLSAVINRPNADYDPAKVIERLKKFDGDFILQTMMLRSADFDSTSAENLVVWREMVLSLHPRLTMVYSLDRPTPQKELEKLSKDEMEAAVSPLREAGLQVEVY